MSALCRFLTLALCLLALSPVVIEAQTPAPTPAAPVVITPGFLTRTGVSIGLAHLTAGDPHFNWVAPHALLDAKANGGFQGVDRAIANRDRLCGARLEGGAHILGLKGGADLYVAYECRIDAHPLSYQRSRWVEFGFRLGTR